MKEIRLLWIDRVVRVGIAVIFLQTLFFKFTGAPESVYVFTRMGIEPWGRILSGIMELVTAVLLLLPSVLWLGALLSLIISCTAAIGHLTILGIEVQGDHGLLFTLALLILAGSIYLIIRDTRAIKIPHNKPASPASKSRFRVLGLLLLTGLFRPACAQERKTDFYDLSASTTGRQSVLVAGWHRLHKLGKARRIGLGYGIRYTAAFGGPADFVTAPAKLTSTHTGILTIFSDNRPENFDTLRFPSYFANIINISLHMQVAITARLDAAFNIDAIGFTFGPGSTAAYASTRRTQSPNSEMQQRASLTRFNALLTSDNDLGSLNSEVLLRYWLRPRCAVKAGATFIFTEYTSHNKLYLGNDRFRNKALVPMIGITFATHPNS